MEPEPEGVPTFLLPTYLPTYLPTNDRAYTGGTPVVDSYHAIRSAAAFVRTRRPRKEEPNAGHRLASPNGARSSLPRNGVTISAARHYYRI